MDDLTKAELARIRDEDQRQNRRIELLEDMSKVIQDLVCNISSCEIIRILTTIIQIGGTSYIPLKTSDNTHYRK